MIANTDNLVKNLNYQSKTEKGQNACQMVSHLCIVHEPGCLTSLI